MNIWPFYLLVICALGFGLSALFRAPRAIKSSNRIAISVYKDQLAEVENMIATGELSAEDGEIAQLEIKRRILKADQNAGGDTALSHFNKSRILYGISLCLLLGLSAVVYGMLGTSKYWDTWAGISQSDGNILPDASDTSLDEARAAYAQLSDYVQTNTDDVEALTLYADMSLQLGEFANAANGFGDLARLEPDNIDHPLRQGEILLQITRGAFTPAVLNAFVEAANINPRHPAPRYYFGAWHFESKNYDRALSIWQSLLEDSNDDAPWRQALEGRIAETQSILSGGGTAQNSMDRSPSDAAIAAFDAMSPEDQSAFIASMVDRLRTRLEEDPADFENWMRLARAEEMLGNIDAAIAALRYARDLVPAQQQQAIDAQIEALDPS